jgi:hypothetical protein
MEDLLSLADFHRREDGKLMLRKCANPACTVPFRSLRDGKLFLAEAPPNGPEDALDGSRKKVPRHEHFWLCGPCSDHFTLRFDEKQGMLTVPLTREAPLRWLMPVNL